MKRLTIEFFFIYNRRSDYCNWLWKMVLTWQDDERYGTYDSAVVPNNAEETSYMIPIVLEPRPYSVAIIHIVAVLFANYGKKCVSFFELYSISLGSFKVVRLTDHLITQGKAKKTRKFAAVKRMISPKDTRMWVRSLRIIIITLTWLCVLTCNLVFHGRFQQRNSHNYCISYLFYQKENPGKRSREKEEGWRKRNTTRVRTSVIFVLWT